MQQISTILKHDGPNHLAPQILAGQIDSWAAMSKEWELVREKFRVEAPAGCKKEQLLKAFSNETVFADAGLMVQTKVALMEDLIATEIEARQEADRQRNALVRAHSIDLTTSSSFFPRHQACRRLAAAANPPPCVRLRNTSRRWLLWRRDTAISRW